MKKKPGKLPMLLIGAGVLALLVCLYIFTKQKASDYTKSQTASYNSLITLTADEISKMSWTPAGGNTLSFTRTDGTWACDTDSTVDLDQDKVNTAAAGLTGISIYQTMNNVTDPSQYGLDAPSYTLTVTDTSGNETTVEIGNSNSTAGSVYACLGTDTSTVYSVASSLQTTVAETIDEFKAADSSADTSADTSTADLSTADVSSSSETASTAS